MARVGSNDLVRRGANDLVYSGWPFANFTSPSLSTAGPTPACASSSVSIAVTLGGHNGTASDVSSTHPSLCPGIFVTNPPTFSTPHTLSASEPPDASAIGITTATSTMPILPLSGPQTTNTSTTTLFITTTRTRSLSRPPTTSTMMSIVTAAPALSLSEPSIANTTTVSITITQILSLPVPPTTDTTTLSVTTTRTLSLSRLPTIDATTIFRTITDSRALPPSQPLNTNTRRRTTVTITEFPSPATTYITTTLFPEPSTITITSFVAQTLSTIAASPPVVGPNDAPHAYGNGGDDNASSFLEITSGQDTSMTIPSTSLPRSFYITAGLPSSSLPGSPTTRYTPSFHSITTSTAQPTAPAPADDESTARERDKRIMTIVGPIGGVVVCIVILVTLRLFWKYMKNVKKAKKEGSVASHRRSSRTAPTMSGGVGRASGSEGSERGRARGVEA